MHIPQTNKVREQKIAIQRTQLFIILSSSHDCHPGTGPEPFMLDMSSRTWKACWQKAMEVFRKLLESKIDLGISKNRGGPPKSSILIGFSIIFTIHFGGPPLFLETPTWRQLDSTPTSTLKTQWGFHALEVAFPFWKCCHFLVRCRVEVKGWENIDCTFNQMVFQLDHWLMLLCLLDLKHVEDLPRFYGKACQIFEWLYESLI